MRPRRALRRTDREHRVIQVALAQMRCRVGEPAENVARVIELTDQAAERGAAVVVFPEMCDTGYDLEAARRRAEPRDGPRLTLVAQAARRHRITIAMGFSERDGERIYNSLAVVGPEGDLVGCYRKVHLFGLDEAEEGGVFTAGEAPGMVPVAGLSWGLSVCYDLRFPELYRSQAVAGAQVLLNAAAWPTSRIGHWEVLARARAIENQAYFLGVNRVGTDIDLTFGGRSVIVSPEGDVVAVGSEAEDGLVLGAIDRERVDVFRDRLPALRDRRPEAYHGVSL